MGRRLDGRIVRFMRVMYALGGVLGGMLDLDAIDERESCCTIQYHRVCNLYMRR